MNIVDSDNFFNNPNFEDNLAPDTVYFLRGPVQLEREITINRRNVTFIGAIDGTTVITKRLGRDGIFVTEEGEGFCMLNITMTETNEENQGCACLVVQANNTLVQKCRFVSVAEVEGTNFTVYYPGPNWPQEQSTVTNFYNGVPLHTGNKFIDNKVISPRDRSCDNFSFSLQQNGLICNNSIKGMLAVYMCKDTAVTGNNITCESQNAIFVSSPYKNISIINNTLEAKTNAEHSTIVFGLQKEHQLDPLHRPNQEGNPDRERSIIANNNIKYRRWAVEFRDVLECAVDYRDPHNVLIQGNIITNTVNPGNWLEKDDENEEYILLTNQQ